jgi:AcrR family transcriptional regulator
LSKFLEAWRQLPAQRTGDRQTDALGKPERTRRRLLGFAMQLFSERGYEATTAADIAMAAGVSRATFFVYFPTKAALLGEVSREMAELWASEPQPPGERAAERIVRFVAFLFRESESGAIGTALLRDFVETYGDDMSAGSGAGTLPHHAEAMIRQAQAEGDWKADWTPTMLAHHLLGTFTWMLEASKGQEPEAAAAFMMQLVLNGTARPGASG